MFWINRRNKAELERLRVENKALRVKVHQLQSFKDSAINCAVSLREDVSKAIKEKGESHQITLKEALKTINQYINRFNKE